jgi:signal peptidase II
VRSLADGSEREVIGRLVTLRLTYNTGGAFSTGGQFTWVFALVALAAAVAILVFSLRVTTPRWAIALGALCGGAASHFGDRMFRGSTLGHGRVIDFIDYFGWFIGNVADIAIVVSIVALLWFAVAGVPLRDRDRADARAA